MGYMRHHGIFVTTCHEGAIETVWEKAQNLFGERLVSLPSKPATNYYQSLAIFPDGSKEWWEISDQGDKARDEFLAWIEEHQEQLLCDWVEVQYGDDEYISKVTRHSSEHPF